MISALGGHAETLESGVAGMVGIDACLGRKIRFGWILRKGLWGRWRCRKKVEVLEIVVPEPNGANHFENQADGLANIHCS